MSALGHATGTVLGQLATAAKSNEIPTVRTLLAGFDLTGVVVTVDAMHTQTDTATAIIDARGDYVFTVKANQPSLYAACKKLPWRDAGEHSTVATGHGRRVPRTIKVVASPAWIIFTGATQVAQIRRTTTRAGKKTIEVVYVITSADHHAAPPPAVLAAWVQGHWPSRTAPTGTAASSTTSTAPEPAPATHPRSWPQFSQQVTPPSACSACPAPPTSPPACDITPPAPNDRSHSCSPHERLCLGPGPCPMTSGTTWLSPEPLVRHRSAPGYVGALQFSARYHGGHGCTPS